MLFLSLIIFLIVLLIFFVKSRFQNGFFIFQPKLAPQIKKKGHSLILGQSGSGKTHLAMKLVEQQFSDKSDNNILYLDAKSDKKVALDLLKLAKKNHKNFRYVDLSNPKSSSEYNPFSGLDDSTQIVNLLLSMSDFSDEYYEEISKVYWFYLSEILLTLKIPVSFESLIKYSNYQQLLVVFKANQKAFTSSFIGQFNNEISNNKDIQKQALVSASRFSNFWRGQNKKIFTKNGLSLDDQSDNCITYLSLDLAKQSEISKKVGALWLQNALTAVLSGKYNKGLLIFDEIQEYATNSVSQLYAMSRSYGAQMIGITQALSNLDKVDYLKQQIFENSNNIFYFRQSNPADVEELSNLTGTRSIEIETKQTEAGMNSEKGSVRSGEEYIVHPNLIKNLSNHTFMCVKKDQQFVKNFNPKMIKLK